jgi:ABC-type uncharacterized transport system permease subunit
LQVFCPTRSLRLYIIMDLTLIELTALLALTPSSVLFFRRRPEKDGVFWSTIVVALCGVLVWVYVRQSAEWYTGLSTALWLTVASSLVIFAGVAKFTDDGWRLTFLLCPYLLILGGLASIGSQVPEQHFVTSAPLIWISTHIALSVSTYALITLAAVAALASMLKERAIKSKKRTRLSSLLPPIASSEGLLLRLLFTSEIVLTVGLITGMAALYMTTGQFLVFDHKTTLTLSAFGIVAVILFVHFRTGIRGRLATRIVFLAYLLLSLGYPGLKFVTDTLISP